jgi:hypothetical protein
MKPSLAAVTTATILLTALAGCTTAASPSSPTMSPAVPSPTPSVSASAAPLTTQQLCLTKFSKAELLAWSPATVKDFRTFQYGGPKANVPLADAFPGVVETTKGAWCGTKEGKDTIRWWAVVAGQQPARVIDINGPGEGKYRGEISPPAIRIPAPNATHS